MLRLHLGFILLIALATSTIPATTRGQIALPPSVIQKQAEHEQKASKGSETGSETRPARPDAHQQLELLKTTALGEDPTAAAAALHALQAQGATAKPILRDVVRQLLARDRAALEVAAGPLSAKDVRELSEKLDQERKAARDNIAKLAHDETLKAAHDHYDSLKGMWEKLRGVFAHADAAALAMSRRGELLALWRQLMPGDHQYSDDAAKQPARLDRLLGLTAAQMSGIPELGAGALPTEPVLRDVWFYRASRRIAAYNATVEKSLSPGEVDNARFVNTYREYLGLLPYELDPRLTQAARDHSSEMMKLKYFAHESPVAANHTPPERIAKAGYPRGAYGENIYKGSQSGEQAFWVWFDSPGHHRNMAGRYSAIGIGQIGGMFTQDFGAAARLMLLSPAERKAVLAEFKSSTKSG